MKNFLKLFFRSLGLEIRKINLNQQSTLQSKVFKMRQDMDEVLTHLKSLNYLPEVIIDCGTADGTPALTRVYPNAFYYFIEPLHEFKPKIEALLEVYNGTYLPFAVGSKNEKLIINVHSDKLGSSLLHESDGSQADGIPREIETITLDSLKPELNGKKGILLKIDVQGFELEVIKGATDILSLVDVIIMEVSFFNFLKEAPDFTEVIQFMKTKGFVVYDIFGGHNRPMDLAMAQRDILFVKENGKFRESHKWADDSQRQLMENSVI
ncbi:MAG: FkbM family methyltransferase [Bacteroidota bacterium]|jgi:FkbM family methyltransferase